MMRRRPFRRTPWESSTRRTRWEGSTRGRHHCRAGGTGSEYELFDQVTVLKASVLPTAADVHAVSAGQPQRRGHGVRPQATGKQDWPIGEADDFRGDIPVGGDPAAASSRRRAVEEEGCRTRIAIHYVQGLGWE